MVKNTLIDVGPSAAVQVQDTRERPCLLLRDMDIQAVPLVSIGQIGHILVQGDPLHLGGEIHQRLKSRIIDGPLLQ